MLKCRRNLNEYASSYKTNIYGFIPSVFPVFFH